MTAWAPALVGSAWWSGLLGLCLAAGMARAAELPTPGERDARVRYIQYVKDDVTEISVRRGSVTRIVLEAGEQIAIAATGFAADCAKAELEWCVRADVGTNQIWVKPKDNATFNNLELHTDRRDYSFEFRVLDDAPNGRGKRAQRSVLEAEPMFRVMFQYPLAVPVSQLLARRTGGRSLETAAVNDRLAESPSPRNWQYSMQVLPGADDIAPALVFDDGRFTYFQFPANREVPSIFYLSRDGEEGRVNYHMEGDFAVVERMSRRFVLRLGKAVVGVWNDAYDNDGLAPVSGTTQPRVSRMVK